MSMNTYLAGRLRNTPLPLSHGLLPLFEAVVNSIHAISALNNSNGHGKITIEVLRVPQASLKLSDDKAKRGVAPLEDIIGFKVTDNGIGFNEENMESFETLDSDYKAQYGCRGVGRLLWLKAFQKVNIKSTFEDTTKARHQRNFEFTASNGTTNVEPSAVGANTPVKTIVHLDKFQSKYRGKAPKTAEKIAVSLFEHCLWYFVRENGAPKIVIYDNDIIIDLDDVYETYMPSVAQPDEITLKGERFSVTHIKLRPTSAKQHSIVWCAAGRVVQEENLKGKIPGLYGKIKENEQEFIYTCYVTSQFLDTHVHPQRIGFDIEEIGDDLFSDATLSLSEIRKGVLNSVSAHLENVLEENKAAGRERVEKFVSRQAPRYRPILNRISDDKLGVDPDISDKDLELLLHKHLSEIEGSLLSEGHEIMNFGDGDEPEDYQERLSDYLAKADDIKKSDLANYVFHRKVILDILSKTIQRGDDGKYATEDLIHSLIMPLRKTSNEIKLDSCNLWLVDERLAFHDFLASDKTLSSMPITGSKETKEPDICALNVFDEPILFNEGQNLPLASIVIVEIKRPMRNDAKAGEDKDPIEQSLGYLDRIRKGRAETASGRPIPDSQDIPGYCYVICDLTDTIKKRCNLLGLTLTSDHLGYFGYNPNFKAYIEVVSFDRLLNSAKERNRKFFDTLGLPTN